MARAFDGHKFGLCGYQLKCGGHFRKRAEWIARTMDKQGRGAEIREVGGAQLLRLARRVQRIRKQEQAGRQVWLFGHQHGRLAAAVGMSAEKDFACNLSPQDFYGTAEAFAIAGGAAGKWRSVGPLLAKRKI